MERANATLRFQNLPEQKGEDTVQVITIYLAPGCDQRMFDRI